MYLGSWQFDEFLTFPANTHAADTGEATDADTVPTYRIYEDETAAPILTGAMSALDAANTTGFYTERIQLTEANSFERGKSYTIYISGTVGGIAGTLSHSFQIESKVHVARLLNDDITDNFTNKYGTPNFQRGFDTVSKTNISAPDFIGIVNSVPTPTLTSFNSLEFTSTDTEAYVGGRITFDALSLRPQAKCIIQAYDGAGNVVVSPIPGGAPGVGDGFVYSPPRDKG